jgi:hypothetical protein
VSAVSQREPEPYSKSSGAKRRAGLAAVRPGRTPRTVESVHRLTRLVFGLLAAEGLVFAAPAAWSGQLAATLSLGRAKPAKK